MPLIEDLLSRESDLLKERMLLDSLIGTINRYVTPYDFDPQTRTMRARGNPRELLAQSSDPAVREFLTRGEPAGKAKPLNPILL